MRGKAGPNGRLGRLLAFAWLAFAPTVLVAQTPFLHRWGPKDGLVQYSVSTIVQDARGYLWFGTESGASRFNGRSFDTFDTAAGFVNGPVRSIVAARTGVWLLGENGECYRVTGERAERFRTNARVLALFPDPAGGDPWLLTEHRLERASGGAAVPVSLSTIELTGARSPSAVAGGLLVFGIGHTIHRLHGDSVAPLALLPEAPTSLFALDGKSVGAVLPRAVVRVNVETGAMENLFTAPEALRLSCGTATGARVVLGTTTGALVVLRGAEVTVLEKGLPAQAVLSVFADREGNLWEGVDSGGVVLLPQTPFTSYTTRDGLGAPEVFYLLADRVRGGVWAGTRNGGVVHIKGGVVRPLTEKDGLVGNRVRAMRQGRDGTVYFGTTEGVTALDPSGKQRKIRPACGSSIRFLYEATDGTMWAGGDEGVLVAIRGDSVRCVDTSSLGRGTNLTCMGRHEETFWVGSGRGLFAFDGESSFTGPVAPGASIRELVVDGQGSLWAPSLDQGAWRLSRGEWRNFREADGFDSQIRFVEIAPDGSPWFGGDRGIWSFPDPRGSRIGAKEGLASENVYLIRFDPSGQLWVGTNRGLNVLRDGRVVAGFDNADGLADDELNANGFTADAEGKLWFCTMGGVSQLDPKAARREGVAPLLDLKKVEVNDRPVLPGSSLLLPHDRSSLRFNFSCQCFRDPTRVTYEYQLDPFDERWSRPTPLEWASYPKVPPGRYTFRVRCASADGSASEPLAFPVEIVPAYWQRRSFHLLVLLLGLGAVAAAVALRQRRMVRRTLELEGLVETRTKELAEAAEEMHRLSITDPLTGARNRRDFEQRIRQELAVAARAVSHQSSPGQSFCVAFLLIDVDRFKKINDSYGHEAGDAVLCEFAAAIQRVIRESDTLFRWGGDEFLVLARQTEPAQVRFLAERLKRSVESGTPGRDGHGLAVTCSIGFTVYPFSVEDPAACGWSELLAIADQGLYLAKSRGRNAYVGFCPTRARYTPEELASIRSDPAAAARAGLVSLVSDVPQLAPPQAPGAESTTL